MPDEKLINKVEAVLFASGKPLDPDTIMNITEEDSKRKLNSALKSLKERYETKSGSLMVIEQDGLWKLTVREEFLPVVRKIVSDTELPKTVLETLAVIAWKAPTVQSEVIRVRTNKAYDHIDQLEKLGFVNKRREGRSYRLDLSEKFFEYFDVRKGDIKTMFKDSKGIEKELELEQKKHMENKEPDGEGHKEEQDAHSKEEIEEAIDAEKPHLGNLEIVDSINQKAPESIQIVDAIKEKEKGEEDSKSTIKEAEEIIEELDEDSEES